MIKMPFEIFLFYDLLDFFFTIVICFNDLYITVNYFNLITLNFYNYDCFKITVILPKRKVKLLINF